MRVKSIVCWVIFFLLIPVGLQIFIKIRISYEYVSNFILDSNMGYSVMILYIMLVGIVTGLFMYIMLTLHKKAITSYENKTVWIVPAIFATNFVLMFMTMTNKLQILLQWFDYYFDTTYLIFLMALNTFVLLDIYKGRREEPK